MVEKEKVNARYQPNPESLGKKNPPKRIALILGLSALILTGAGCGRGRKIPGIERAQIFIRDSHLYMSFVATKLTWNAGITAPIPGLPESSVSIAPDISSQGSVFQISISLHSLINKNPHLPWSGLPDGRAIPDIHGGRLPRWDFHIEQITFSAYLAQDVFGLFVPLKLRTRSGVRLIFPISMKIQDERGNTVGKAYAIPANMPHQTSGLLVLIPLPKRETEVGV